MKRMGIVGGGQLAKMMAVSAQKMGFFVTFLDPTPQAPASGVAHGQIIGDFDDAEKLRQLVEASEITTFDLEHVDTQCMKIFSEEGFQILPSPALLETIQNKFEQKKKLLSAGLPTARFDKVKAGFEFPMVQKLCRGGYDGRGVVILSSEADMEKSLKGDWFVEEKINIAKEIAVMVARTQRGEVAAYPVAEMVFEKEANILDYLFAPADVRPEIYKEAQELAIATVKAFEGVGIFGVELFLDLSGKLWVNEVAPRPHNSGHYTIEACATNQFEQHIRAICNLPLGSVEQFVSAAMVNLLGPEGETGEAEVFGIEKALELPGVSFHWYGKFETKPFRKMGHITAVHHDRAKARELALEARERIQIRARSAR